MADVVACRQLVKKIAENYRLPYFTITPTFSICPVHGYIRGEHHNCPFDKEENETGEAGIQGLPEKVQQEIVAAAERR
jgi:ribonucleoside-triphosphate reductase